MNDKIIKPAERVTKIDEYYFSRKLAEVAEMRASGKDIISLAIGGPDLPPSSEVIEALCLESHRTDTHSYQNTRGIPELRKAYAEWYKRIYNVTLNPDNEIIPLIGSKEGIIHILLAFTNPGDGVLVPNPGYPTYTSASKIAGAVTLPYNLLEKNDWQPDFDELEALLKAHSNIKLMFVNYPHMPTGAGAKTETFQNLVNFGIKHGLVIVHDNPYSFILNDKPQSILEIPGAKDVCIELNSLSKSHNMAGWRVAMLATNPTFAQWILKVKSNVDSGQFLPVMKAAVKALEAPGEWYAMINKNYGERRYYAEKLMESLGCKYDKSQRGMFLWGKVPEKYRNGKQLADALLYEAGVFITPGFIFGGNGNNYIRVSLCAPVEKLNKALERIEKWKS